MAEFIVDKDGIKRYLVSITVNGNKYTKMVKANSLLVNFLREDLNLTGTKERASRVSWRLHRAAGWEAGQFVHGPHC